MIAGMHRSGTSALARVANLRGADFTGELMPPRGENTEGFWEAIEIVATHEKILESVGSSWHDLFPIPAGSLDSPEVEGAIASLHELVKEAFLSSNLLLIKDPRLCRLLPIWHRLADVESFELRIILPFRNPLEVAASLKARDDIPEQDGLILWLRNVLEAERESRGSKRSFTSYDGLLDDWRKELEKVAQDLEFTWPVTIGESEESIEGFLSRDHKHHQAPEHAPFGSGKLLDQITAVFEALTRLRSDSDDPVAKQCLDSIYESYEISTVLFRPIVDGQVSWASELTKTIQSLQRELKQREGAAESILTDRDALRSENEDLLSENGAIRSENAALRGERDALWNEREILRAENLEIMASTSWKVTAPLRSGRGSLNRVFSALKSRAKTIFLFLARRIVGPSLRGLLAWSPSGRRKLAFIEHRYRSFTGVGAKMPGIEEAKVKLRGDSMTQFLAFLKSGERIIFPVVEDPDISVIIVLHNQAELTFTCLKSLSDIVRSGGEPSAEIILVDNASSDSTDALLDRIDGAKISRNRENPGFLKSVNAAVTEAVGETLLLLNNDAVVRKGALLAAFTTLQSDKTIGAVGARIVLPNGHLQEAGDIIWSDGSCLGYLRGEVFDAPSAMFRRDVDYCSGVFLLTPRRVFEKLGGFDDSFAPAYYEETDYCLRLRGNGLRIVYEPNAVVDHYEFGSSEKSDYALELQKRNQQTFFEKHQARLTADHYLPSSRNILKARSRDRRPRILFIDDRVPLQDYGAGCPRAIEMIRGLVQNGWFVTLYPLRFPHEDWEKTYCCLPVDVEVMQGQGVESLGDFLEARRGYYDDILVSRPHNMQFLSDLMTTTPELLEGARLAYDAEAVFALREIRAAKVLGRSIPEKRAAKLLADELELQCHADQIFAVSEEEAKNFRNHGFEKVHVLGHAASPVPTPSLYEERSGLLFVGSLTHDNTPNTDSMVWFIEKVLPLIRQKSLSMGSVTMIGRGGAPALQPLSRQEGCHFVGRQDELEPFYNSARVFIAPTRFAAGIPLKAIEAAAHGLPIVATRLIGTQLGWQDGEEILIGDTPEEIAEAVIQLYENAALWNKIRTQALERVSNQCSPEFFRGVLSKALPTDRSVSTVL